MDTTIIILLTAVYLLVGFQIGGRAFYYVVKTADIPPEDKLSFDDYVAPLVAVPIAWPIVLLMSLRKEAPIHDILWNFRR